MRVRVIWVGRTKERFIEEGIKKYLKHLRQYVDMQIEEIKEQRGAKKDIALQREGRRILSLSEKYILLDERGRLIDSLEFASLIKEKEPSGKVDFVLGGAFGVSKAVKEKAEEIISLSPMTLTHEISRIVFLEQLYRAFTINKGKDYHH